jgi:hypothetical protein
MATAKSKPADLAALTLKKGAAAPAEGAPQRSAEPNPSTKPQVAKAGEELVPLNFRVPSSFRTEFEEYAFNGPSRRKMVQLLKDAFEALKEREQNR